MQRVLFALTAKDQAAFLPRLDMSSLPAMEEQWLDPSKTDAAGWEDVLRRLRPQVLVSAWGTPALPPGMAAWPEQPSLYVCHLTGSVRSVVARDLVAGGFLVTNWGSSISYTIAEHALLLVLGALRNLPRWRACLDAPPAGQGPAKQELHTRSLRGKRVGIHGFGAIARELVGMLHPFGVTVSAYSAGVPEALFQEHGVRPSPSLEELFASSEVLIECEAWTPQTAGAVSGAVLEQLPAGAVFVNVGRGWVVDEPAMVRLAAAGRIRIALDVFQHEPLPADDPLRHVPGALLSPHIAGPTEDALALAGNFALANLRHYLNGERERMQGVVTLDVYDRIT